MLATSRSTPRTATTRAVVSDSLHQPVMIRKAGTAAVSSPSPRARTPTAPVRWSLCRASSRKRPNHRTAHSSQMTAKVRSPTTSQEWTAKPTAAAATTRENQPSPSPGQPVMPLMPTHR
jgi:hypothetical protein